MACCCTTGDELSSCGHTDAESRSGHTGAAHPSHNTMEQLGHKTMIHFLLKALACKRNKQKCFVTLNSNPELNINIFADRGYTDFHVCCFLCNMRQQWPRCWGSPLRDSIVDVHASRCMTLPWCIKTTGDKLKLLVPLLLCAQPHCT